MRSRYTSDNIFYPVQQLTAADIPIPPTYTVYAATDAGRLAIMTSWLGMFDALGYREKNDLGEGEGHDVDTPNIFEYRFGSADGFPVLIDAGMHPNEYHSFAALYWLAQCMTSERTSFFAWMNRYCDVRVIPFLCPQGFRDATYTNANGVNLNRNFAVGADSETWLWGFSETEGNDYAGSAQNSEAETLALIGRMAPVSGAAPKLYINCHQSYSHNDKVFNPTPANQQFGGDLIGFNAAVEMANELVAEYDASATVVAQMYYNNGIAAAGYAINHAQYLGIPALLIENDALYWVDEDTTTCSSEFTQSLVGLLAAFISTYAYAWQDQCNRITCHAFGASGVSIDAETPLYEYIRPAIVAANDVAAWSAREEWRTGLYYAEPADIGPVGYIRTVCRSTIEITMSGSWHSDDTGNSKLKLRVENANGGDDPTSVMRDALAFEEDVPATKTTFETKTHVYHGMEAGVWKISVYGNVSTSGVSLTLDDINISVKVYPTPYMIMPTYAMKAADA